jgi:hypothetical protein
MRNCCRWALAGTVWFLAPLSGIAGSFDCSVVYDEFEQLMNKAYLVKPDNYVPTLSQKLSREQFLALQQGKLLLYPNRQSFGVAIIRTTSQTRGKILFDWDQPPIRGKVPLKIVDGVTFGRVLDGYAPQRLGPILIKSGTGVDLDSGTAKTLDEEDTAIDIVYRVKSGIALLEGVNGATLEFPIESLCRPPSEEG